MSKNPKHRTDKGSLHFFIRRMRIQRHYILNQWHYFKKPKLKKWWKETVDNTTKMIVLFINKGGVR